jgi:hypothetical protein
VDSWWQTDCVFWQDNFANWKTFVEAESAKENAHHAKHQSLFGGMKMRAFRIAVSTLVILASASALAASDAQKSFEQIKSLSGSWEGKAHDGRPVQVSYRVTSMGSAVLSEISGHEDNMISMFHLDGANRLLITHYCGAGNQPRMLATASPDGKTITFDFLDATNLDSAQPGHMQRLVIAILDANHHTEEWSFNGKDGETKELFDLWRKK